MLDAGCWMLEGVSEHGRQVHQRECGWRKEAGESTVRI
jgi:hypothetical protein